MRIGFKEKIPGQQKRGDPRWNIPKICATAGSRGRVSTNLGIEVTQDHPEREDPGGIERKMEDTVMNGIHGGRRVETILSEIGMRGKIIMADPRGIGRKTEDILISRRGIGKRIGNSLEIGRNGKIRIKRTGENRTGIRQI